MSKLFQHAQLTSCVVLALGCGSSGGVDGTIPPNPTSARIVWESATGPTPYATPGFDATSVYFRGVHDEAYAVNKFDGKRTWTVNLPATGDGIGGHDVIVTGGVVVIAAYDLYGLSSADGSLRWQFHPTVGRKPGAFKITEHSGVIYTGSTSGHVYAIDAANGSQKWVTAVLPRDTVSLYTPVYQDGVVYVSFTEFNPPPGVDLGGVVALDAETGTVKWLTWLPHKSSANSSTATTGLTIANNIVVTDSNDGPAYALDIVSGAILWTAPASDPGPYFFPNALTHDERATASFGNKIFIGSTSGYVAAFDLAGNQLWRSIAMRGSSYSMKADQHFLYVIHAGGQLVAFDVNTGAIAWIVEGPNQGGLFLNQPAIDGNRLYLGGVASSYAIRTD